MLYTNLQSQALFYGNVQENNAREELASVLAHLPRRFSRGRRSGEIKRQQTAKSMTPDEAFAKRICTFWLYSKKNGIRNINTNYADYYKIQ
ncbi:hypothetical protein B566_EDAN017386 [Ephemera danica]|nr:hypothetical protein B566_EDAN017386 [Ephemera danica]